MENSNSAVDPEGFASLVDMIGPEMPEMVAEILDTYLVESEELLELIDVAQAENQPDDMLRPVHSMKSSSASVGAMTLSATCAELEQYLRGHGPELDVDAYVSTIHTQFDQAKLELTKLRDEYAQK